MLQVQEEVDQLSQVLLEQQRTKQSLIKVTNDVKVKITDKQAKQVHTGAWCR